MNKNEVINEEIKTETQIEPETKCTKKDCRLKEKELEQKEEIIRKTDTYFSQELNLRYSFFINLLELTKDHCGQKFVELAFDAFKQRQEEIKTFETIKDEKGQAIKCSFCEEEIKGIKRWGMDENFFQASDEKKYCLQCYRIKFPKEIGEKHQKVDVLKKRERNTAKTEENKGEGTL